MLRRSLADLYEEAPHTLLQELDAFEQRKKALGGRRGPLPERSIEFIERSGKLWRKEPLAATPLPSLRRAVVEDAIVRRAAAHPRSAKNELEHLKAVLREARSRGQRIDPAIFDIPSGRPSSRVAGRALTVDELYELASWFPEHVRAPRAAGPEGLGPASTSGSRSATTCSTLTKGAIPTPPVACEEPPRPPCVLDCGRGDAPPRAARLLDRAALASAFPTISWQTVDALRISGAGSGSTPFKRPLPAIRAKSGLEWPRAPMGSTPPPAAPHGRLADGARGHGSGRGVRAPRSHRRWRPLLGTYRHLYEGEKRAQAQRLEELITRELRSNTYSAPKEERT